MPRPLRAWATLLLILCPACVQEGPSPRPPPRQPEAVSPDYMAVFTGWPTDGDGNGFLDRFTVTVMLFDDRFIEASLQLPGVFEVHAVVPGSATTPERLLGTWVFDTAQAQAALRPTPAGPSYEFRLSILDVGTDQHERLEVQPKVTFRGPNGESLQGRGGSIWLGRPNR